MSNKCIICGEPCNGTDYENPNKVFLCQHCSKTIPKEIVKVAAKIKPSVTYKYPTPFVPIKALKIPYTENNWKDFPAVAGRLKEVTAPGYRYKDSPYKWL